jgi:Tfp pilus assembly pilus retraction ATPase PilT
VAIRNLIRNGQYVQIPNYLMGGRDVGMHTMQSSLERLLERGVVTQDEVMSRLNDARVAAIGSPA